ncbi:hypothetical protein [Caulobacter sp. 602-1]|uniref:hypothetical protein n=1 Tax=unclassified Caulobacter TaxID=2648921 RepID=UPI0013153E1B|nr:hypothetical protein [Caulobacter sp. 602-1]
MSALMVLLMSSLFVLAAMVGLADALVHFLAWSIERLKAPRETTKASQSPAQGMTA